MKKILIATCILSLATISPVFAKDVTTSAYRIASAGYTSSSNNGPGSGYNNGPGSGYSGFTNGYQNSSGQESLSGDAQKLQQWLDANPVQAQQIQSAIQNSPDQAAALKKWLEAHPEQAAQIKGLF